MNNCLRDQIGRFWNALKVAGIALFVWAKNIIWRMFFAFLVFGRLENLGQRKTNILVNIKLFFFFGKQAIDKRHATLHQALANIKR